MYLARLWITWEEQEFEPKSEQKLEPKLSTSQVNAVNNNQAIWGYLCEFFPPKYFTEK